MNEGKEAQRRRGMKREGETNKVKREGLRREEKYKELSYDRNFDVVFY